MMMMTKRVAFSVFVFKFGYHNYLAQLLDTIMIWHSYCLAEVTVSTSSMCLTDELRYMCNILVRFWCFYQRTEPLIGQPWRQLLTTTINYRPVCRPIVVHQWASHCVAEPDQALYTYSACRLYQLGQSTVSNSSRLRPHTWNTIRELGIAVRRPTKRGCRGGRQRQHQQAISTVIGHLPTLRVRSSHQKHHDNLIQVRLTANPRICPPTTASLCIEGWSLGGVRWYMFLFHCSFKFTFLI